MPFIDTIAPAESEGAVRDMYQRQQDFWGYVPNYAKLFSHRPEVLARWGRLLAEIRRHMDDRRFELATFAAAYELKNTACSIEHGKQLAKFIGEQAVIGLVAEPQEEGLTDTDRAVAALARKIARDATSVTAEDVTVLKDHGLSDAEIFDVAAAAAGRAFFTKLLDGLGGLCDAPAQQLAVDFRKPLTVGRPICEGDVETLGEAGR